MGSNKDAGKYFSRLPHVFIHKVVIVKHAYDVAPEKLGKSGCILLIFFMINPAVAT